MQTAVHGGLHIAAGSAEVCHGAAFHAVAVGQLGFHVVVQVVQLAAFGVNSGDQLRLTLVGEAAQPVVDGAGHHVIGTLHAVVDAAAPQDVLQRNGVVAQVEGSVSALQPLDQLVIADAAPILRLGVAELLAVHAVTDARPRCPEVRAVPGLAAAAGVGAVGGIQLGTEVAVKRGGVIPQPIAEIVQRTGVAGEHIQTEGGSAGVVGYRGNRAGVSVLSRFVVLTQCAQTGVLPVAVRGDQYCGDAAHQHYCRQDQCQPSFRPFHVKHPALSLSCMGTSAVEKPLHRFT